MKILVKPIEMNVVAGEKYSEIQCRDNCSRFCVTKCPQNTYKCFQPGVAGLSPTGLSTQI